MPIRFHLSRTAPCTKRNPLTQECCGHEEPGVFAAHVCNDFALDRLHAARAALHGERPHSIATRTASGSEA